MYKYLIIGIALVFTLSGNYYIRKAGGEELISKAISGEVKNNLLPLSDEEIIGLYVCDVTSGCKNKHILLLKSDKNVELLPTFGNNSISDEVLEEILTEVNKDFPEENNNQSIVEHIENSEQPQIDIIANDQSLSIATASIQKIDTTEKISNFENNTENDDNQKNLLNLDGTSSSFIEIGTWEIGVQNILVINLTERGTSTYEIPQKIVVVDVGTNTLSRINFTRDNYINMLKPVFIKQE